MKQWFRDLPGPTALKIVVAVLIGALALAVLFLVYDWIGTSLLDTGGTIG